MVTCGIGVETELRKKMLLVSFFFCEWAIYNVINVYEIKKEDGSTGEVGKCTLSFLEVR